MGHGITLADAYLLSTLTGAFESVIDKKTRDSKIPNLSRYMSLLLQMEPIMRVLGQVVFTKDLKQPNFNAAAKDT